MSRNPKQHQCESRELFRSEVQAYRPSLSGAVVLPAPVSSTVVSGVCVSLVVLGGVFLCFANFPRTEEAQGWVVPQRGLGRLTAGMAGTVVSVDVEEGETLAAGASVARVRSSSNLARGGAYEAIGTSLDSRRDAGGAREQAALDQLAVEQGQLSQRRAALDQQVGHQEVQLRLQTERARIADEQVARAQEVARRGFLSTQVLEQRRSTALQEQMQVAQMRQLLVGLQREIDDVDQRLEAIPVDMRALRASAKEDAAHLRQERAELERTDTVVVPTYTGGKVVALPIRVGEIVSPETLVAVVAPAGSAMAAELFVPSRGAGMLEVGQKVRLRYQAFPYQQFGFGGGTIAAVSGTVLAPDEVRAPGVTLAQPSVRVLVKLDEDAVSAYRRRFNLRPGMLLSADVVIARRSLFQWLLDPVMAARRSA